mgnify:CR=1 FL=1
MRNLFILLIVSIFTFGSYAVASKDALSNKELQKPLIAELKHELNIADEQVESLIRILSATNKNRDKVLKRFGIKMSNNRKVRLSLREKLSLKKEMEKVKYQSNDDISNILNEQQMLLWIEFQSKKQSEFKKKLLSKIN